MFKRFVRRTTGGMLFPVVGFVTMTAAALPLAVTTSAWSASPQTGTPAGAPLPRPVIVLSPDGARYATLTPDNKIELRGRSVAPTAPASVKIDGPREFFTAIAFSPDGRALAATTSDKLRVWDVQTGRQVAEVDPPKVRMPAGSETQLSAIAYSQSGNALIVSDSRGFTALATLAAPDNPVFQKAEVYGTVAPFTVLAGDGRGGWLAGDAAGNLYTLGNIVGKKWRKVIKTPPTADANTPLRALATTLDGSLLATRSDDNQVRFWQVSAPVPSGEVTVTLSRQQAADTLASNLIWETTGDMVTGLSATGIRQNVALAPPPPPPTNPPEVAVTTPTVPVNPTLANPNPANSTPPVTPVPANPIPVITAVPPPLTPKVTTPAPMQLAISQLFKLVGHSEYVNTVAFSPDGKSLASGSRDKTVRLWDAVHGMPKQILGKHDNFVSAIVFSPNGQMLASGGWDKQILLWNLETGRKTVNPAFQKSGSYVLSLAYSPDGARLACGGNDKTVRLYPSNGSASKVTEPLPDGIASVAFSPDGNKLAGGCLNGNVYIWDAHTLKLLHRIVPPGVKQAVYSVVWLSNALLASSGKGGAIHLWNAGTGVTAGMVSAVREDIYSLAFDPAHGLLATGGTDRTVRFWSLPDLKKGKEARPVAEQAGHSDTVRCLAFSSDGARLASGGWDFNIFVWHIEGGSVAP